MVASVAMAACGDDDDGSTETSASGASGATDATSAPSAGSSASTDVAVTGDSSAGATTTSGGDGSGTAPAGEGDPDASIVVGAVLEPTNLDIFRTAGAALDQVLLDNVYETLLSAPDPAVIEPGLAELPEVSEDGLTYTFTLQEGVTFHDGDPLTADDVVYSLDQFRAETGRGAELLASIDTVTAVDDTTVEVTLSERDNNLPFLMTRRTGAVVDDDAADLENSAVGTGPFSFVEFDVGASITLRRYDEYWGDPAGVAEVTFQYFTDPNAAVNAFTTGDVEILTGVNTDLVAPLQENPDYVVNEGVTNGEYTLAFNNERAPLDNRDVRQAIRQAIDKQGIVDLYNGYGTIIGAPVPPTDPWYEDLTDTAPFDPDAARALLEGAGVEEGTPLTLTIPNFYPTNGPEYIASQLADVGLDVEINVVEFPVWLEQVFTNADYDLSIVLHVEPRDIANYANPDYYYRYDNPDVQQLIADAKTAETEEESVDLVRQAARQIAEDSPADWLILYSDLTVSTPDVTGYPTDDTASRFDASNITVAPG